MILPDHEIINLLDSNHLVIEPLDREIQVQPASVDVRLGDDFKAFTNFNRPIFDISRGQIPEYKEVYEAKGGVVLDPGDFVLATTIERVEIPNDILGTVEGRSSIGRLGIMIHATAGIIDPGYEGEITLEISNVGDTSIRLRPGMRIAQLVFSNLTEPCATPYGEDRGSKYQNQEGAQASRLDQDQEITN